MKGGLFGDAWWKENLRMKKSTFDHLCNELRPYITRQTVVRKPVSVEERVAVTLWRLAIYQHRISYLVFSLWFRPLNCVHSCVGYMPSHSKVASSICVYTEG